MNKLKFLLKPLIITLVFLGALWSIAYLASRPSTPLSTYHLSPEKGDFKAGEEFQVEIILKTDQEINGADVVLSFDPSILEVVRIKEGGVFPLYPRKHVDTQKGRIEITGVKTKVDGQVFTQPLTFATMVLRAKKPGQAKFNFVFSRGKTTGSTIVKAEGSKNILEKVYNGEYIIN